MLNRHIAILIAGGLLSAQVTAAAAAEGTFPPSADDTAYWNKLPAQEKYFADRAAANPNPTGASERPVFPSRPYVAAYPKQLPAMDKYFDQRAAANPNPTGASGGVFGTDCLASADDTAYWNRLPAQARHFK